MSDRKDEYLDYEGLSELLELLKTKLDNRFKEVSDTAIINKVTNSEKYKNDLGTIINRITSAENKITDTAIINTVTRSDRYQDDITNINNKIDSRIIFSDSEPSNPVKGNIWINSSNGNARYLWNGESWIDVSNTDLDTFINDTYTTYVNQTADKIEHAIGSIDKYGTRTSIIEQNIDSMMNQLSKVQSAYDELLKDLNDTGWNDLYRNDDGYSYVKVRQKNGVVYIEGSSGSTGIELTKNTTMTVATLPHGYEPNEDTIFAISLKLINAYSSGTITTDGKINLYSTTTTKYWGFCISYPL